MTMVTEEEYEICWLVVMDAGVLVQVTDAGGHRLGYAVSLELMASLDW